MADNRLAASLALHFDPHWGAPYWCERRDTLGFDPLKEVREVADLMKFPPFAREDLVRRSVEDFIPRKFHDRLREFITSETGGTTGAPARTVFREDEFHAAFVAPFLAAAERMDFPKGQNWMFIGPSGPHPIGKAARECARACGSIDPFMVDFDPRWARRLSGFARGRYLEHVTAQALAILETQHVGVLFTTPPVLTTLGECLPIEVRERIKGVHLGGMPGDAAFWSRLQAEWFPNAKVMAGYGNSLLGMCPQLDPCLDGRPRYFPHGDRLVLEVVSRKADERGVLVAHRLDESCFLPHLVERDEAASVLPPDDARALGFVQPGVWNPGPPSEQREHETGLY